MTFDDFCFIRGVNVLGGKSELEKAMEKRNRQRVEIEKKHEDETSKTDFQRVLAQRAKRIDAVWKWTKSFPCKTIIITALFCVSDGRCGD